MRPRHDTSRGGVVVRNERERGHKALCLRTRVSAGESRGCVFFFFFVERGGSYWANEGGVCGLFGLLCRTVPRAVRTGQDLLARVLNQSTAVGRGPTTSLRENEEAASVDEWVGTRT